MQSLRHTKLLVQSFFFFFCGKKWIKFCHVRKIYAYNSKALLTWFVIMTKYVYIYLNVMYVTLNLMRQFYEIYNIYFFPCGVKNEDIQNNLKQVPI